MIRQRIVPILIFLPVIVGLILAGGWLYTAGVAVALVLAAFEFGRVFHAGGYRPAGPLLVGGVMLLAVTRHLFGFDHAPLLLTLLILAAMIWHLADYERGAERSGTDFALTLAGTVYVGWLGAYLVSLRDLAAGMWWVLLVVPSIWVADIGAFLIGSAIGRHTMVPRLSPKKTWEGYLGGVLTGGLTALILTLVWMALADPGLAPRPSLGLLIGVIVSTLAPLGDLGISMIKRELAIKDTGHLFPGHGGALDRIDTWLWASALGFYAVVWSAL